MQITQVPLPPVGQSPTPQQQSLVNGLHHVQVQAVQPITQNAVAPAPEANKSEKPKERKERDAKDRDRSKQQADGEHRGDKVNISV